MPAASNTMRIEKNYNNNLLEFQKPIKRIGIEINQKCNLKCSYCWNQQWNTKEIEIEKVEKILYSMFLSNPYASVTYYAAEPLLSLEILLQLLDKFPSFYHNILTNGTLLEGQIKTEIEKRNPHLIISLDGIAINHNKYRNNSFNKVIQNILNYKYPKRISLGMTVNIDTLPYLYDSLEYMDSLPIGSYETHLNLHEEWTDQLFFQYIKIIETFIKDKQKKTYLPNCGIDNRFANYFNAKYYSKDGGGPLHQIDVECNVLIQKPQRSCLNIPDKEDLFYGKKFANENGFLNTQLKKEYEQFMINEYLNYNFYSINCDKCRFNNKCKKNRYRKVYLDPKECYPILELFIMEEKFWKK